MLRALCGCNGAAGLVGNVRVALSASHARLQHNVTEASFKQATGPLQGIKVRDLKQHRQHRTRVSREESLS